MADGKEQGVTSHYRGAGGTAVCRSFKETCSRGKKRRKQTTRRRGVDIRILADAILAGLFLPVIKDLYRRSARVGTLGMFLRSLGESTIDDRKIDALLCSVRVTFPNRRYGQRVSCAKANNGMDE